MADGWLLMVAALLGELVAPEPIAPGPARQVIATDMQRQEAPT